MLYLPPASSCMRGLHGPHISEQESARLASSCASKGSPSTTSRSRQRRRRLIELEKDDWHDEAARIIVQSGRPSRPAAAAEDRLQPCGAARGHDGSRGPGVAPGGKPREVLVDKHYFDEVDAQLRYPSGAPQDACVPATCRRVVVLLGAIAAMPLSAAGPPARVLHAHPRSRDGAAAGPWRREGHPRRSRRRADHQGARAPRIDVVPEAATPTTRCCRRRSSPQTCGRRPG